MLEDLKRTFGEVFGWVFTILPIGRKAAFIILIISFVLALAGYIFALSCLCALASLGILLALFVSFFFRDPVRETVFADDEIACPADGKVISVKTEKDPDILVVRIFLSVFNVHIQRSTISGKVGAIIYTKGAFAFANNPDADKNERNFINISKGERFAHVEQITGAIARRIQAWVKTGDEVKAGQKVGLIYFGSQVAVYLPKDKVRITVKEGQSVQGGVSLLGLWK